MASAREAEDAGLRGGVGAGRRHGRDAVRRRREDDRAALARPHLAKRRAAEQEAAREVDVEHALPLGEAHRRRALVHADPRVRVGDVQAVPERDDACDELLDVVLARRVSAHEEGVVRQLPRQGDARVAVDVEEADRRPGCRERADAGRADAAGARGHDGDAPLEHTGHACAAGCGISTATSRPLSAER
jgi:hypothetical protein